LAPDPEGRVEPGFEAVADELAAILAESPGTGAAFAAYAGAEPLVDIWGGVADGEAGAAWQKDTIQLVFSGTKGLVATCLLLLLDRGALELDAPVARYWPEFAAAGKGAVTVAQAVSHMAAVPGLRDGFSAGELLDGRALAERVAAEAPFWEPGTQVAYHALTYGAICDELVRSVDGRSVGRFFAEELARPLGLDLWIGLPLALEPRVARLQPAADYGITHLGDEPEPLLEAVYGDLRDGFQWNEAAFHRAEIPGANAIGTARSLARLYGCLASGGEGLVSAEAVRSGRAERARGICAITRRPYAFGVGFELQTELGTFGPPSDAFGHTGSGGSSHGAWPTEGIGFSFAMNELLPETRDRRARRLLSAVADSLDG
jgi:CubicO group peptidase (beta-lactamase class C family)